MKYSDKYLDFVEDHGIPIFSKNIGIGEIALSLDDALLAVELLNGSSIAILGGDIVTKTKQGEFAYVLHDWGESYVYLNFYCDREKGEDKVSYANRSHEVAKKGIAEASKAAKQLGKECLIVLVVE